MSSSSDPGLVKRCRFFSAAAAVFSMAVGLAALAGWTFHVAILKNWLPGHVSVRANAAVCFLLLGVALWNLRAPAAAPTGWTNRRLGSAAAAIAVLVAFPALLENLFGWNLGIDQLLFTVHPGDEIGSLRPGLIPLIPAFDFVLLGAALLALDRKTRRGLWPSEWLALAALIAGLFGVLDFVFNRQAAHTRIALPGILFFVILPLAVLCARPEWALGGLLTGKSAGARLLRKALPAALIVLGLIGAMISRALLTEQHFSWLEVAALAVVSGLLLAAFLAWNAYLLDRSDRERLRAEDALGISREDLELLQSRPEDSHFEVRLRRRVVMGLTIAIVLTTCLGFASWHSARQAAAEADWVEHSQSVRTKISSTVKDVIDMENGARGFALAGQRDYLDPYDAGRAAIPKDLRELRTLTADNANQQKRLDVLEPQIRRAVDVAEEMVRERSLGRAIPTPLLRENKTRVDAVRVEITAIDEEELRLLDSRSRAMASARNTQVLITIVVSVLGLAFLAIGGVAIHGTIDDGALARSQVKALNSTLERRVEERTVQLHQNEQRLQGIVKSAMDAIITVDEDENIVLFNPAAEKMFGCKCADALGRPLGTLIPERFRNGHPAQIRTFTDSGETRRKMADLRFVWGLRADGNEFPMEVSISRTELAGRRLLTAIARDVTERQRAEEALRAKEEQLRLLLEGVKDYAVYMLDPAGLISTWNAGAARIKGYIAEEVLGKPISIFYTAEEQAAGIPAQALQQALAKGRFEFQGLRVRKDGSTFWAHAVIVPLYNQTGQLRGFSKVLHDITQQRRDEEALRASEERLQALANGIPQLAWMANPDGHIFWYNERWYEYTGTTFEQMEGWAWQSVHDPVELPKVMERWKGAIASGKPFEMEFPLRGGDGRFRIFLTRVMPLKDSNGQVVRWFGTNTDIGERKEVEEKLKESEHRYRTLFNEMVVAFALLGVIYDEEGKPCDYRYLAVNSAFETESGLPSSVVGKTIREALPDLDPFWFETYGRVATSGESVHVERYVQAITRWVDVTAFRASEGQVGVTFSDVTKRKEAELQIHKLNDELEERVLRRTSELESANKELEAFTYSVSHDLRAPLRHISGFSKLLSEEYGPALPAEAQHHVQRIQEGTRRMGLLVDDLLNLGRIGRQEMRLQVTDLKSVVREVIEELAPECEGRQIEWRVGQLPFAQCDPGLLRQVFQNLIANAIKFTRPRTPAVIEVGQQEAGQQEVGQQEADGSPIIFVRDNGVGFSMKYCDKLFGVFQRLHRAEDFEGTGVGLATVHRIIQKHDGRIWAEAALDKGATFSFTIGVSENADRNAKAVVAGGKV